MEEQGSLGLYLSRNKAVAVWISAGHQPQILHKLNILPNEEEPATIALRAARAASRQGFAFDEVYVAVDCGYYTQYNLHSEFEDYRQIESTIKYDAEEAAATDAMNLAVTFEVTGVIETGSQVTVYTADRQLLTDMLLDVQEGGVDPSMIEPDVVCLRRALEHTSSLDSRTDTIFVILSRNNCYMLRPNPDHAPMVRTFLVGTGQNVTNALSREVLLATAAATQEHPIQTIALIGNVDAVDTDLLNQRTGMEVQIEIPEQALSQTLAQDSAITADELLIAYGAALAMRVKTGKSDFRRDFMPYQGRRKVMEGSLRLMSISLTVLLIAIGAYFQLKVFRMNGYSAALEEKLLDHHKAVAYGKGPVRGMTFPSSLKREYARAQGEAEGGGVGDDKSVPAKLTYFFEAVNSCPAKVDVDFQNINVTETTMKVKGDTNVRSSTMVLFDAIKKHPKITLSSERISPDPKRDKFEITIDPK